MKIVINTNYNSAATKVCVDDLIPKLSKSGHQVSKNDWDHYDKYDLALFMSADSEVEKSKKQNPGIKTGIMDPKITPRRPISEVMDADFLLVSSIEQRDFFYKLNKNIIIYFMFPDMRSLEKQHTNQKEKLIIGYHGNLVHLHCFSPTISNALSEIGAKRDNVELWVMYNIEKLGEWSFGLPENIKIKHIQWSEENYYKYLSKADIGLVNTEIPIRKNLGKLATSFLKRKNFLFNVHAYHKDDYLIRFKYSTNPGRIYVFNQLGIPVISDFSPSSAQFIRDDYSGFIVHSKDGWKTAIENLLDNPEKRTFFSNNLRKDISNNFSIEKNFEKLNKFIEKL